MDYNERMQVMIDGEFNTKILCAMAEVAIEMAGSSDAPNKALALKVAVTPKLYAVSFATMVASQGAVSGQSPDASVREAVVQVWPIIANGVANG